MLAAIWRTAVQNRLKALYSALASFSFTTTAGPYNGQVFTFNTHPLIEGVQDRSEDSISFAGSGWANIPQDYTSVSYNSGFDGLVTAVPTYFTTTAYAPFISFGVYPLDAGHTEQGDVASSVANCSASRGKLSNSDTQADPTIVSSPATSSLSWGQKIYIGFTWNGSSWVTGGTDYRGTMAFMANV